MGGSIPPRSNISFRVTLLEINGRGGWLINMVIRWQRIVLALFHVMWSICWGTPKEVEKEGVKIRRSPSLSEKLLHVIGLRTSYRWDDNNNNDSDEEEEVEVLSDKLDEELPPPPEEDDRGGRGRVAPYMRGLVTAEVKTGSHLMWGGGGHHRRERKRKEVEKEVEEEKSGGGDEDYSLSDNEVEEEEDEID